METDRQPGELSPGPASGSPGAFAPSARGIAPALLAFLAASFILFGGGLTGYFVIDDLALIHTGASLARTDPAVLLLPDIGIYWRPVVKVSMALDALVWGYEPFGYHLTSVVLHGLCCLLVFLLAGRLARSRAAAWTAGGLFALHPIHYYTVGWISARYDLMCTLFTLGALLAFLAYRSRRRRRWAIAFLVLQGLALFSKEMAFTLPVLAAVVSLADGDGAWRRRLRADGPLLAASFGLLGIVLAARVVLMGGIGGPGGLAGDSLWLLRGAGNALAYLLYHLPRLLFYPSVGAEGAGPVPMWVFTVGGLAAFVLLVAAWRKGAERLRTLAPFGLLLISCLPFAPFIMIPRSLEASYVFYLPSAFFAAGAGWVLFGRSARGALRVVRYGALLLLFLVYPPLLASNNAAFGRAADLSRALHDAVVRAVGPSPGAGRVFLWNLPQKAHGVYFFFDEPGLLFLREYDVSEVALVNLNQNHLARRPDAVPLAREPGTVRLLTRDVSVPVEDGIVIRDLSAQLADRIDRIRRAEDGPEPLVRELDAGGRLEAPALWRYAVLEVAEWEPAAGEVGGSAACELAWSGTDLRGSPIEGRLVFPRSQQCRRILVGADPRWLLADSLETLSVEAAGGRARAVVFRGAGDETPISVSPTDP